MAELPLLGLHWAATLLMTGIIWFVQVVHYPLMHHVGRDGFVSYSALHRQLTTMVVLGPMLLEVATAIGLGILYPVVWSTPRFVVAALLLGMIWASTFCWQVPLHHSLGGGYCRTTIARLVRSNWLRTVSWSLRAVIIGSLCWDRMAAASLG